MKREQRRIEGWRAMLVGAALVVAIASCSSTTAPSDTFLPIFTNFWHDVQDNQHTFSLNSTDDSTASGTFDGEEDHPTLGTSQLDGTFNHSKVTMTIHRAAGNLVYTGRFIARDTMSLTSSAGALRIARQ
jgi:hypothetical protein